MALPRPSTYLLRIPAAGATALDLAGQCSRAIQELLRAPRITHAIATIVSAHLHVFLLALAYWSRYSYASTRHCVLWYFYGSILTYALEHIIAGADRPRRHRGISDSVDSGLKLCTTVYDFSDLTTNNVKC